MNERVFKKNTVARLWTSPAFAFPGVGGSMVRMVLYGITDPNIPTYSSESGEHEFGPEEARAPRPKRTKACAYGSRTPPTERMPCHKSERYAPLGPPPDANEGRTVRVEPIHNVHALGPSAPRSLACVEAPQLAARCGPNHAALQSNQIAAAIGNAGRQRRLRGRLWSAWTRKRKPSQSGVQRRPST